MSDDRVIETSRPPSVVTYVVKINGTEIPEKFKAETIIINKEVNRIPSAKIVFVDGNASEAKFEASNGALFIPGNEIEVQAGYEADNKLLFKGIIIKQSVKIRSNNAILTIDCKDKAIKMTAGKKNGYYTDGVKDSDVMDTIINRYGISADIEQTTVTHKELIQFESTDWDFIVTRADVNGRLVIASDGAIAIKNPIQYIACGFAGIRRHHPGAGCGDRFPPPVQGGQKQNHGTPTTKQWLKQKLPTLQ